MSQPANDDFSQHLSDDEASYHKDASDNGTAINKPKQQQQQQLIPTTTIISNIKLPILKKEEYDIWAMDMEHYLEYIDNDVWKVIQNGNSKKRILTGKDGVVRILPPVSAAEIHAVEKERKARTILLMAIPKEHLRRFHGMDDAKEIWEAIRTRFGGNVNSKKMQKVILKQQFKAFTILTSEGLEKGYDRFQQLLSQLEAHGAEVSTEDANHKFLRSLPLAWLNLAMTMRTKPDVDTLSIDDLNNNLRSNTNKVKSGHTSAYSTYTPSTSSNNIPEREVPAGFANEVIYLLFAKQSEDLDLLHEDLEQIDDMDIEEMDINWQIAMIAIRMKKECPSKGTNDGKKRDSFYQGAGKKEQNQNCLLIMDNGIVNWGEHTVEEEKTNHALMAISSNNEVSLFSKTCIDSYNKLKTPCDEQTNQLGEEETKILAYTLAVKKLEAQVVTFQNQQLSLNEQLTFQANEIYTKDEKLKKYRRIGMKLVKEKEQLLKIVDSWKNSSKNLWKLVDSSMTSNSKVGLGYEIQSNNEVLSYEEEMNRTMFKCTEDDFLNKPLYSRFSKTDSFKGVPHLLSGDYTPKPQQEIDESLYVFGKKGPQKLEISDLDDTSNEHSTCQSNYSEGSFGNPSEHSSESESESISVPNEMSTSKSVTINEKAMSESKEVKPSCVTHVKTPRQPMKNKRTPKVKGKNWNEMMERELGEGYFFIKKKCFVCGSLSHLIRDCDFYEKKMAREAELKKQRVFNTGNGVAKLVWNNANRVNRDNYFIPKPVQLNTGRANVSSVKSNVNSVRHNVNSVRTNVNTGRSKQPVPTSNSNSFSPVRPQVNKFNQRSHFSKLHSPVRRPIVRNTARMTYSYAVKGNWGTADHPLKNMEDRGIFDSGCSGHMARNKDHLDDFEECKGGSVTFGDSKGYIIGKGRIRHKVLFTKTECLAVSLDFKMPDENQILLKVSRQHNMYSFDMKTPSLTKDYACLIAKATSDESKLWHRRLGHINIKNLNKLVKGNLVRGLPSKDPTHPHVPEARTMIVEDLLHLVPNLITKVDSLEIELKQTKLTMGKEIVKLVKKVKKLEDILKRKHVVFTDLEDEEPEDQGRIIQDIDDDPIVSKGDFGTPTKPSGEAQEEEISPTTLEAAKILSKVASQRSKSVDKGKRYKRRKESKGKDIDSGFEEVNTGKAPMIVEETQAPKRTKEQIQQEEASLAEAIRLQTLEEEETAKQVHLDALLAKRIKEEEELIEQQKQRKAQVQFEAQHYTEEDWDAIRAKLEANAELTKNVLGKELPEEDFAKKMVELVNQRNKFFAEERAKARRRDMEAYTVKEVKEEFDKLVKQVESFVPINIEATKAQLKRYREELQTEILKKQRIDVSDTKEKVGKVKEEEPVKRVGKRKKQKARKGISIDKSPQGDSETDKEESVEAMNPTPLDTKSNIVANWKIFQQGERSIYQIIRANMLKDFEREDLIELYRLVMQKYGTNRPEDAYDRVLWSDLRTMFDPPLNEDAIWSLPLQQKMISWRYYDKCAVHCLTLEACSIYMLADRKYPLSKDACQVMLKMKLLDGKMNEVCYKLLKMIEKQAGVKK
ncbi:ribonuclease H-like domain-containing protein [Tanacetum coccineum]|uniref:Ribonuclease H-like domain-containing protein n=1 Tax=Tanacetum coccineum TaxID=301880 RepID=A0ABQ5EXA9_9ASTR